MLNDPAKPDVPLIKRLYVTTDPDGSFQFSSVRPGDGIPPGKYVVTFALLKTQGEMGLVGPDRFNNLYNDPDKNGKIEEFTIDHKAPGKSDYVFDLRIAGEEAATPGPHSLTNLVDETDPGVKDRIK